MKKSLHHSPKVKGQKKRRLTASRMAVLFVAAILLTGLGTVVFSQSGQDSSPAKNGKKYVAKKETIFDQSTGKLRKPTEVETQAIVDQISALTNRSSEGLTPVTQPNGMTYVNLEGRFNGVVLGRANADGTTEVRCVFTMEEAAAFLGLEAE